MAADFHRKTAALFEEFKRRELHFLNTEANSSNVNWKNNINTPLQEYMQKISKREQETEKTYKDLMRQMEDLGKQTDQMTLKLEKLNALRNVALSYNISSWPLTDDTYDRPFQTYYSNSQLQNTPKMLLSSHPINDFPQRTQTDLSFINQPFQLSSSKPHCQSVTTQTEYIFCDNCHFPLILKSELPASNVNLPQQTNIEENEHNFSHKLSITQESLNFARETTIDKSAENQNLVSKSSYNISDPLVENHSDSDFNNKLKTSGMRDISLKDQELINQQVERRLSKNIAPNTVVDELSNETFQKRMSESYTEDAVAHRLTNQPFPKTMSNSNTENVITDRVTHEPIQKRMSKSYIDNVPSDEQTNVPVLKRMSESYIDNVVTGDYVTHTEEKQYVEVQDNDLLSTDGNYDQIISKSDDESMSHEFSFLDSDKSKNPKKQPSHQMAGDASSQMTDNITNIERLGSAQLESNYAIQSNSRQLLQVQQTSGNSEKTDIGGKDLTYSIGPPSPSAHSENTSVVSESDSFSDKETPLTATAAYQALLGNVNVAKPKQRSTPISDTDSEDEIENVLASAVRRTSKIAFDAAILDSKVEKRKESIVEIKTEKNTKLVDSVSNNKPQNKLSKNTRKVLGLDTSSGSEVELEVKSPVNKIEEESDEFDFYD